MANVPDFTCVLQSPVAEPECTFQIQRSSPNSGPQAPPFPELRVIVVKEGYPSTDLYLNKCPVVSDGMLGLSKAYAKGKVVSTSESQSQSPQSGSPPSLNACKAARFLHGKLQEQATLIEAEENMKKAQSKSTTSSSILDKLKQRQAQSDKGGAAATGDEDLDEKDDVDPDADVPAVADVVAYKRRSYNNGMSQDVWAALFEKTRPPVVVSLVPLSASGAGMAAAVLQHAGPSPQGEGPSMVLYIPCAVSGVGGGVTGGVGGSGVGDRSRAVELVSHRNSAHLLLSVLQRHMIKQQRRVSLACDSHSEYFL